MKILLFGHRGQVGSALCQALPPSYSLITSGIDMTDITELRDIIISNMPDIIINAAAYTNVDGAEDNPRKAFETNALAPRIMAEIANDHHIQLIHYSSDYVFDGSGSHPWVETDIPYPLNIYGQSKREGECHIIKSGCRHLIFRTSWVYDMTHENFVTKVIHLSRERDSLQVISDQIGAPTSARFIARATCHAIKQQTSQNGLYHLCCAGETSWYDYARFIIETQNIASKKCDVIPVSSNEYGQKARRPLNSRLDCKKFIEDFNLLIPDWKTEYLDNHIRTNHKQP